MVYGYYASGADTESTVRDNRAAFARYRLLPRMMVDVSHLDPSCKLLGKRLAFPVIVAPMAMQQMAHPDGELAVARACASAGIPMGVSTMGTYEKREVMLAGAGVPFMMYQLYVFRDRDFVRDMVQDAERAGYTALAVTVDAPFLGNREADTRNSFKLPEGMFLRNVEGLVKKLAIHHNTPGSGLNEVFSKQIDASLTWDFMLWLRTVTKLPVYVKGILSAADAQLAVDHGVDGIIVSNHGGRQLDFAPAAIDMLPSIRASVGQAVPVLVDGGVRRGTDIIKALALGADVVLLGRPPAMMANKRETDIESLPAGTLSEPSRSLLQARRTSRVSRQSQQSLQRSQQSRWTSEAGYDTESELESLGPDTPFMRKLREFYDSIGEPLKAVPRFNKQPLDMEKLWDAVQACGGYDEACRGKSWAAIGRQFNPPKSMTNLSYHIKRLYEKHMLQFEQEHGGDGDVYAQVQKLASKGAAPQGTGSSAELSEEDNEAAMTLAQVASRGHTDAEWSAVVDHLNKHRQASSLPRHSRPAPTLNGTTRTASPAGRLPKRVSFQDLSAGWGSDRGAGTPDLHGRPVDEEMLLADEELLDEELDAARNLSALQAARPAAATQPAEPWDLAQPAEVRMPATGEELVGFRIKVWWAREGAYHKAIITGYSQGEHTIDYEDNWRETLDLSRERWHIALDDEEDALLAAGHLQALQHAGRPPSRGLTARPQGQPVAAQQGAKPIPVLLQDVYVDAPNNLPNRALPLLGHQVQR
ncbi:hypothetical protein WJX72_007115 [[Myrmecia] bisecta]|uniref:(S)-2-hydroxy-acid oxidase n=1 Tax=[Myrmecia] bisecta TaxID=41462 RepID=A0AAW1PXI4_9CHLO